MAYVQANTTFLSDENQGFQLGQNYGTVSTSFVLPVARPETPPHPSSTVPFRRDPDFVERGDVLTQIHEKCSIPASCVALVGLGGIGKSQLAIEYLYRVREQSPQTWVFWVHASTAARFEDGYRAIAERAKISGWSDPKANILQLVYSWLSNEKNGKWVMVVDNADDVGIFDVGTKRQEALVRGADGGKALSLATYLPQSRNGSILATTRDHEVALRLVGTHRDVIKVGPMSKEDALALFRNKLEDQYEQNGAMELAGALDRIPLAISQAAAFIRQRAPRFSIGQYIEKFRKNDRSKASLLNYDKGDSRRDESAKNSIIITWQISFEHIRRTAPSAADLLSLMSFFDRQGIPASLLQHHYMAEENGGEGNDKNDGKDNCTKDDNGEEDDDDTTTGSEGSTDNRFEDDIVLLRNYSMITVNIDVNTFEMHRLVQLSTRKWLEEDGQLERWKEDYVDRLSKAFPSGEHQNWKVCQSLFAHAEAAMAQKPQADRPVKEWAHILHNGGWYAWATGRYTVAEKMLRKAIKARQNVLGSEEPSTRQSEYMLGLILYNKGRYREAEEQFMQVVETNSRVLGLEHPNALASMNSLALTYGNQGRWKEAEDVEVQVMETRKRLLGQEHPDTLISMGNLASTYSNQGRWKEAEDLEVQVMETRKRMSGQEHPDTLISMNNLASTYSNQGRWKEAEDLEVQVMETSKRVLGQEHPDTLTGMNNLAFIQKSQGHDAEALDLMRKCVELRKLKLGADHIYTVSSLDALIKWETAGS